MTTNYDHKGPINLVCPRCSGMIPNTETPGAYPGAISRWTRDDREKIEVCSGCGTNEALLQFFAHKAGRDPLEAVHPVTGDRPWDSPPEVAR